MLQINAIHNVNLYEDRLQFKDVREHIINELSYGIAKEIKKEGLLTIREEYKEGKIKRIHLTAYVSSKEESQKIARNIIYLHNRVSPHLRQYTQELLDLLANK